MQTRSGKRACAELSPISEGGSVDAGALDTNIQQIIQESLKNAIPGIMREIQKQLEASITDIVAKSIETFRKENQENMDYLEDRSSLKAMSEAEKLEQYNRRDNLKIYNVDEKDGETYEQTMDAVVNIAHIGAEVDIKDISIAHRLSGRRRAIIVKFARRTSKIKLLQKKKKLAEKKDTENISIMEDTSDPRLAFMNMMKQDYRIKSVWILEGTINFVWNTDKFYKIDGMYEAGCFLNYNFADVKQCFRGVFKNSTNSNAF